MSDQTANWIAVDWGTSNLRLWVMSAEGDILARHHSDKGMSSLSSSEFEPELLKLAEPYLGTSPLPVICCGMAGAKQGWMEAAYQQVPCQPPSAEDALKVANTDSRISVYILPGLMQKNPADVMRGEETQIAGFLAKYPEYQGSLCLPGTHTKWVSIRNGEISQFTTMMTGELFALISAHSVLRHSIASEDWSDPDFEEGVAQAAAQPAQLASALFRLRADDLLNGLERKAARARLSGLLIGLEIEAAHAYLQQDRLHLIGAESLCSLYQTALQHKGITADIDTGDELVLDGLISARQQLKQRQS